MEWLVLTAKVVAWSTAIVALAAALGFVYQRTAQRSDKRLPPGKLVSVSGREMHLLCMGDHDGPTVVLEAGGSNSSITSRSLQTAIAKFARVCAYDRAGYGYSEPVNQSRTFDEITADLDELLAKGDIEPPYILVGESMGGLMVRNFHRHHLTVHTPARIEATD